jgi:hypothetical protein
MSWNEHFLLRSNGDRSEFSSDFSERNSVAKPKRKASNDLCCVSLEGDGGGGGGIRF